MYNISIVNLHKQKKPIITNHNNMHAAFAHLTPIYMWLIESATFSTTSFF